jgi:hypothetical protein
MLIVSILAITVVWAFAQGCMTNRERDMYARVVLLTVRMLASHMYPHYSLDQGGFTPLGLTLMQSLVQRGAHIIALSPEPVRHPEVETFISCDRPPRMIRYSRMNAI